MSWEPVVPVKHSGGVGVRACIRIHRSGGPLRVIIALGSDVLRKMDWEPGIDITVLRGSDEDLGRMRLSRGMGQGYKLQRIHASKNGKDQHGLSLPLWKGLPEKSHRMAACDWKVSPGGQLLEITLPRWARGSAAPVAAQIEDLAARDPARMRRAVG